MRFRTRRSSASWAFCTCGTRATRRSSGTGTRRTWTTRRSSTRRRTQTSRREWDDAAGAWWRCRKWVSRQLVGVAERSASGSWGCWKTSTTLARSCRASPRRSKTASKSRSVECRSCWCRSLSLSLTLSHTPSFGEQLLLHGRKQERAAANLAIVDFLKKGTKIRAMYADDDNEPAVSTCDITPRSMPVDESSHVLATQMYEAVIDSVEENHEFWVTFPEYGNSEKVSLGDIEFERSGASKNSRSKRSLSRSRSAGRGRSRSRERRDDRRRGGGSSSSRHRSHRDRSRSRTRHRSRSRSRERSHRRRSRSRSRSPSPRCVSNRVDSVMCMEASLADAHSACGACM